MSGRTEIHCRKNRSCHWLENGRSFRTLCVIILSSSICLRGIDLLSIGGVDPTSKVYVTVFPLFGIRSPFAPSCTNSRTLDPENRGFCPSGVADRLILTSNTWLVTVGCPRNVMSVWYRKVSLPVSKKVPERSPGRHSNSAPIPPIDFPVEAFRSVSRYRRRLLFSLRSNEEDASILRKKFWSSSATVRATKSGPPLLSPMGSVATGSTPSQSSRRPLMQIGC